MGVAEAVAAATQEHPPTGSYTGVTVTVAVNGITQSISNLSVSVH